MSLARVVIATACVCAFASEVRAQDADPLGRVEIAGGVRRSGPSSFGRVDANQTTAEGGTSALFSTRTQLDAAIAIDGRLGFVLTRALQVEVSVSWGQSDLSTRVSSDIENIPDVTVAEPIRQLAVEAAITAHIRRLRIGSHGNVFLSAGAGYLRELHEDRSLVETGRVYHVGGGVQVPLRVRPAGRMKAIGIRADARALVRTGATAFDEEPLLLPLIGASVFVRF